MMTKLVAPGAKRRLNGTSMFRNSSISCAKSGVMLPLVLLVVIGCETRITGIQGLISVDGTSVESGVVSFRSVAGTESRGASIEKGRFDLSTQGELAPGKYVVTAQCFQSTGRTFNDPQRGPIPERVQIHLADDGQRIEISPENADDLKLEFHAKVRK